MRMHAINIPVLKTRRLVLRGPEAEDHPDLKATFSSYHARFMGGMLYAAEIATCIDPLFKPKGWAID
jgi:hypothetical protein